ncbi:MAG TPA: hypothetical protein VF457_08725 [Burkholderiaceae bacterium]
MADYNARLLNTERDLQFRFAAALRDQFQSNAVSRGKRRRLYLEPELVRRSDGARRYPDVAICDEGERIIGLVELKYTPRVGPIIDKDVQSLKWYLDAEVSFLPERYLGPIAAPGQHQVAHDAVLCWAGIYANDGTGARLRDAADAVSLPANSFLQLHALTHPELHAMTRLLD